MSTSSDTAQPTLFGDEPAPAMDASFDASLIAAHEPAEASETASCAHLAALLADSRAPAGALSKYKSLVAWHARWTQDTSPPAKQRKVFRPLDGVVYPSVDNSWQRWEEQVESWNDSCSLVSTQSDLEMYPSYIRAAQSVSQNPLNFQKAAATIYPPVPLYRRLLRAHRKLPIEMRSLGDAYVKDEFRRHREVSNPVYVMGFLTQWKMYLDELPRDPSAKNFKKLDAVVFEKMSADQLGQLYELMHASKDVWKPISEDESDTGHRKS